MHLHFRFLDDTRTSEDISGDETLRHVIEKLFDAKDPIIKDRDLDIDEHIKSIEVTDEELIDVEFKIPPDIELCQRMIIALENEQYDVFLELIKDGRVDPSYNNSEAITWAAYHGNMESFQILFNDERVDPFHEESEVLSAAVESNNIDIVGMILNHPDFVINDNIFMFLGLGCRDVLNLLLQDGRHDPSYNKNEAFIHCVKYFNVEILERLVQDSRVDPSDQDSLALMQACIYDKLDTVDFLLGLEKINPAARSNRAIKAAAQRGHLDVVKRLCRDDRVNPHDKNYRAIKVARKYGHVEVVQFLGELMRKEK